MSSNSKTAALCSSIMLFVLLVLQRSAAGGFPSAPAGHYGPASRLSPSPCTPDDPHSTAPADLPTEAVLCARTAASKRRPQPPARYQSDASSISSQALSTRWPFLTRLAVASGLSCKYNTTSIWCLPIQSFTSSGLSRPG